MVFQKMFLLLKFSNPPAPEAFQQYLVLNLSKKLFMSNVNISQMHPTGLLSFLYDIFLSHSVHFATTTIDMESI